MGRWIAIAALVLGTAACAWVAVSGAFCVGCGKPLFNTQVGSTTQPAFTNTVNDGAIRVATSLPSIPQKLINFEKDALNIKIEAPVQQQFDLGRIGFIALVVLAFIAAPPWQWPCFRRRKSEQ